MQLNSEIQSLAIQPEIWSKFSYKDRLVISKRIVDLELDDVATLIIKAMPAKLSKVQSITFVINSLSSGGAERNGINVANLLASEGYQVQIIYFKKSKASFNISPTIPLLYVSSVDSSRYEKIYNFCSKHKTDTVVLLNHWIYQNFKDIFWFKLHNYRVIAQEHSNFYYPIYNGFNLSLINKRLRAYKVVDCLTCLSTMDVYLWKLSGINKVCYVPNLTQTQLEDIDFNTREAAILILSRMTKVKGLDRLPSIIFGILSKHPEIKFYLVGGFESMRSKLLFKLVLRLKLGRLYKSVIFFDFSNNPEVYLKKSRCLLIPSHIEGSPMVICEARSKGTPIVLYGMNYIDNAQNGVIHIKKDCVKNWVDALSRLTLDEKIWKIYSKDCFNGIDRWFSDSVKKHWNEIFNRISMRSCESGLYSIPTQDARNAIDEFYSMLNFLNTRKLDIWIRLSRNFFKTF